MEAGPPKLDTNLNPLHLPRKVPADLGGHHRGPRREARDSTRAINTQLRGVDVDTGTGVRFNDAIKSGDKCHSERTGDYGEASVQ